VAEGQAADIDKAVASARAGFDLRAVGEDDPRRTCGVLAQAGCGTPCAQRRLERDCAAHRVTNHIVTLSLCGGTEVRHVRRCDRGRAS
jgi:hypothetical protein